jgi:Amt family ammonium transporter
MGLTAIAEYVEGEEILKKLQAIGVPYGQGFHLGPPGPLDALFPGDTPPRSA